MSNLVEGGQISVRQSWVTLSLVIVGADAVLAPGLAVRLAGQDAVFAYPFAAALAGSIIILLGLLSRRHPGQTIVQIAEETWGSLIGKLIGAFFILWLIQANAIFTRTMADLTLSSLLEQTPQGVVLGVLAITTAVMVVMGLEGIARFAEFAFWWIWGVVVFLWAIAAKDLEIHYLLPLMTRGALPILRAALPISAVFGEIVVLGMFLPFIEEPRKVIMIGLAAEVLALIRMMFGVVLETALFSVPQTSRFLAPTLELGRAIQVAGLVERVDAILVGAWLLNGFVKIAVFLYAAVLGLAQLTRLSDYRRLAFPVMATTAVLGFGLFRNTVDLRSFIGKAWGPYALAFEIGVPFLVLLASFARGKATGEAQNQGTNK